MRLLKFLLPFILTASPCWADDVSSYFQPQPMPMPAPLQGIAKKTAPAGGALQGGIKDQAQINPSVRLIPFQQEVRRNNFGGSVLTPRSDSYTPEQFRGGARVGGPLNGGVNSSGLSSDTGVTQLRGSNFVSGSHPVSIYGNIPPISTYTYSPGRGVIDYGMPQSFPGNNHNTLSGAVPATVNTEPPHYTTVGRGITVLEPDLAVSSLRPVQPMVANLGSGVQMIRGSSTSISGLLHNNQTALQATASPYITHGGITALPGYEVTITPPGLQQETLGGRWSGQYPAPKFTPISLTAIPGTLTGDRIFTRAEPVPVSQMATAGLLSGIKNNMNVQDWPSWYRAVARAIYTHWQTLEVCPGTAHLEVTVKPDHDISGRVVDFTPAPDVERNVPRETEFRERAVGAIDNIGYFEIPNFPSKTDQVVFDIDLKRLVDGPGGVSIVGVPSRP